MSCFSFLFLAIWSPNSKKQKLFPLLSFLVLGGGNISQCIKPSSYSAYIILSYKHPSNNINSMLWSCYSPTITKKKEFSLYTIWSVTSYHWLRVLIYFFFCSKILISPLPPMPVLTSLNLRREYQSQLVWWQLWWYTTVRLLFMNLVNNCLCYQHFYYLNKNKIKFSTFVTFLVVRKLLHCTFHESIIFFF